MHPFFLIPFSFCCWSLLVVAQSFFQHPQAVFPALGNMGYSDRLYRSLSAPWTSTPEGVKDKPDRSIAVLYNIPYLHSELGDPPAGSILQGTVCTCHRRGIWERSHGRAKLMENLSAVLRRYRSRTAWLSPPCIVTPRNTVVTLSIWRSHTLQESRQKPK